MLLTRTARALFIAWDNRWRSQLREADDLYIRRGCRAAVSEALCCSGGDDDDLRQGSESCCCFSGSNGTEEASPQQAHAVTSFRSSCSGVIAGAAALSLCYHALQLAAAMLLRETLREISDANESQANQVSNAVYSQRLATGTAT